VTLIQATYVATRPDREPGLLAENIAREQSLEIPSELIPAAVAERFLGRVIAVERREEQRWAMTIGYPVECASGSLAALLQLLYGNVSFYPRIRLTRLGLPAELLAEFPGPMAGLKGIRKHIDAPDRALLLTVLKPRGAALSRLVELASAFARGGGDILKDDQNIVDRELGEFRKRIAGCAEAVERAADSTGRRCLYLPHVSGSGDELKRRLAAVVEAGLSGVVLCPWALGLEAASRAARDHGLMWLAHPAMAGVWTEPDDHGISPAVLLGTLVRLAGADISIFPGRGGRIASRHADEEKSICEALTGPLGHIKLSLPCSGGGKTLDQAAEFARSHGPDGALVVGGDLLRRGRDLESATRATIQTLAGAASSRRDLPD
jgi:ribulose-bisphosphate carboxylase large chain